MPQPAKVSVIATVLNEAETIDGLVSSLARQTVHDYEIIIVDGGSTDGTWERLQKLASQHPNLRTIRDESCNLKASPGPIARGRNRAIREASAEVIACADGGCQYEEHWAERLTAPILAGEAEYALGGSWIDPAQATIWDIAAAPFLGVKLRPEGIRKSCTARSMAFRKQVWERVGGFPEISLFGEDTLFDLRARRIAPPAFPAEAMARYTPSFTLSSAAARLGLYAASDGMLGVRRARLVRNLLRCVAQVTALIALHWTAIPTFVVVLLEIYFAFEHDVRSLFTPRFAGIAITRLLFSFMAPWIVTYRHLAGSMTKANQPNTQNVG